MKVTWEDDDDVDIRLVRRYDGWSVTANGVVIAECKTEAEAREAYNRAWELFTEDE